MKKLTYLLAIVALFAFTACGGGANNEAATEEAATEVVTDAATEDAATEDAAKCCGGTDPNCCADGEEGDHDHGDHDHDGDDHTHE